MSILWFPLFTTVGFLVALKFIIPDFLADQAWLTFGRLRPAHVNGVLYGFISSGLLAGMLYIVPRLCDTPLKFSQAAKVLALIWNAGVLVGIILILNGNSQGREYAEMPWIIDVVVMAGLLSLTLIVFATIISRQERKLFVSLWYYLGTVLWFPIVYFIGNVMWKPATGALNGTIDGIFNWYFGHNVLGLWFTTLGIAAWYYTIAMILRRPIYSHLLSLIGFFSIAFFYTGVGEHHLLQAPIPEWLKTEAVLMSALMAVPVITFATNILLTVRGSAGRILQNIPLRFIMAGFLMYVITSFQGSLQSLRTANAYLHFSQWPVAHAHLALLGGFGFLVVGLTYWIVPQMTGVRLYSHRLMSLSFWMAFMGFIFFFSAMTIAGLIANASWWFHINVVEALPMLRNYFIVRAISGGMIVVGAYVFAINIIMTYARSKEPDQESAEEEIKDAVSERLPSRLQRQLQEKINIPIIVAGSLALFGLMTFMVVAMPYMFTTNEPAGRAHVLSVKEKKGESLYRSLGCYYCHNQFIRTFDWAYGQPSDSGDFFYSVPNFLGTERTGPPLGQIGGKRPSEWHLVHYGNPQSVSPSSIMPHFTFLQAGQIEALADYIQNLGGKDLETRGFQPMLPQDYENSTQPQARLLRTLESNYNAVDEKYNGDVGSGKKYARLFEEGKKLYAIKCLPCHGCSGNGQGPYARSVVTKPANLHERISDYPQPADAFHFWRISEGVPGTAMPPWKQSLSKNDRWLLSLYETGFVDGSLRTVDGTISDDEAVAFAKKSNIVPAIRGTSAEFEEGKSIFELYCAQCHGKDGHGDGPASIISQGGYIKPQPSNFEETGTDFRLYGQYYWKVTRGVETTNMPPWKFVLSDDEIHRAIFYVQNFALADDYNNKWGLLYRDGFAKNLKR